MKKLTIELLTHEVSILLRALLIAQKHTLARLRRASDKIPGHRAGLAMETADYKSVAEKLAGHEFLVHSFSTETNNEKG